MLQDILEHFVVISKCTGHYIPGEVWNELHYYRKI